MKALILAAGFNTRLERDLNSLPEQEKEQYKHLLGKPKSLIPIAGKPLIEYLLEQIKQSNIEETYIITNQKYFSQFQEWGKNYSFNLTNIINNGAITNETRKGAIADLEFAIQKKNIDDDLLVVAGDILFSPQFQLKEMIFSFYLKRNPLITVHEEKGDLSKRGVVEINKYGQVLHFLEKPPPGQTNSQLASTALYLFQKSNLNLIKEYLNQAKDLNGRDAPGNFIAWLYQIKPIFTFKIPGRYDVGSLEDYLKANQEFKPS